MKNKFKNKTVIIFAIVYLFIGVGTAIISNPLTNSEMQVVWRLASLIASIIIFISHIKYEIINRFNSPRIAAINTSGSVALGAFALAVLANIYALMNASTDNYSLLLALIIWPIVTGLISFLAAHIMAKFIIRVRPKD